jgi:hypothetical protein
MYIVYNCGYYSSITKNGPVTGKRYAFRKKFVTEVANEDGQGFLEMTFKDVQWCERDSKDLPPFISLEDWCNASPNRCTFPNLKNTKYNTQEYLNAMLLR